MFTLPIGFMKTKFTVIPVEFVGSEESSAFSTVTVVTRPAGYQTGDFLIILAGTTSADITGISAGGASWTTSQNGTFTSNIEATSQYMDIYTKVGAAGEPATYTVNFGTTAAHAICLCYRNVDSFLTQALDANSDGSTTHTANFGTSIDPLDPGSVAITAHWLNQDGTTGPITVSSGPSNLSLLEENSARGDWLFAAYHRTGVSGSLGARSLITSQSDIASGSYAMKLVPKSAPAGPAPDFAFVDSTAFSVSTVGTDIVLTMPGTVEEGDIVIISAMQADATATLGIGTPAGYTLLDTIVVSDRTCSVFYKTAGGGEGNPTVPFSSGGGGANAAALLIFRGAEIPTSQETGSPGGGLDPVTIPDYTEHSEGYEIISVVMRDADGTIEVVGITPGSFTNIIEDSVVLNMASGAATVSYKENTSSGTISLDIDVDDGVASHFVRARILPVQAEVEGLTVIGTTPFDTSASATDITLTLPGSTALNDLILLTAYQEGGSFGGITGPAGYTQLSSVDAGDDEINIFYKFAAGGEGDPTVNFTGIAGDNAAALVVFRNAGTPTSEASGSTATQDPIQVPDYTEAAPTSFEVISVGLADGGGTVDIVGITPVEFTNLEVDSVGGAMGAGACTMSYKANDSGGTISYDIDLDDAATGHWTRVRVPEA